MSAAALCEVEFKLKEVEMALFASVLLQIQTYFLLVSDF